MSLKLPPAPESYMRAVEVGIADLRPGDRITPKAVRSGTAFEIFTLDLNDIEGSKDAIENDRPAGWRFIAVSSDGSSLAADVFGTDPDARISGVSPERSAARAISALKIAERICSEENDDCVVRILSVPSVLFEGLWVHSTREKGHDRLIPLLAPGAEKLELKPLSVEELLRQFRELAPKFREFDQIEDEDKEPPPDLSQSY